MMNNPILAEWETQVRIRNSQQIAEQLRLERLAESPSHLAKGQLAGLSPARLRDLWVLGLVWSSSLARRAWNRIKFLSYDPPVVEEKGAEV